MEIVADTDTAADISCIPRLDGYLATPCLLEHQEFQVNLEPLFVHLCQDLQGDLNRM